MRSLLVIILSVLLLGGCSAAANTKAAEGGVVGFHSALDAGKFDAIYAGTGQEFKAVTPQKDFTDILAAIHRKLGKFKTGKTMGWNATVNTRGHYVTLNREAQFERGPAQEQFVFKIENEKPTLVGYHINSNLLITG